MEGNLRVQGSRARRQRNSPCVVFATDLDITAADGYSRKILGQARAIVEAGFCVTVFGRSGRKLRTEHLTHTSSTFAATTNVGGHSVSPLARALYQWRLAVKSLGCVLRHKCRAVYIRRLTPATPTVVAWIVLLRILTRFVGYEYPTYPYAAENRRLPPLFRVVDAIGSSLIDPLVSRLFVVPSIALDKSHHVVAISNGVDADQFPLRTPLPHSGLNLIAVAYVKMWHGFDRVISGLAMAPRLHGVHFHIVGLGPDNERLRKLVTKNALGDSVTFHGDLLGTELDSLFDLCDIAVGSLGLHRIGASAGAHLKTREYCCRGIPMVLSYDDPSVTGDFVLRTESSDAPLRLDEIGTFLVTLTTTPPQIREFARERLSWNSAMFPVTNWLHSTVCARQNTWSPDA